MASGMLDKGNICVDIQNINEGPPYLDSGLDNGSLSCQH